MNNKNNRFRANYETACGIKFSLVRELGEKIDTVEMIERTDRKIVPGFLGSVDVVR